MARETFTFQAEVGRLLNIVAHSLYSHKEIFVRELVSNASDACDRLRYAALTNPELAGDESAFEIRILIDREKRTLSVKDNGIGLSRTDMVETLGTIARSGTQAFISQLTGDSKKDLALIGQFGVGFYSSFMVADRVDVISRKAGEEQAWCWSSNGLGSYEIEESERGSRGTDVVVHLKAEEDEYLETTRVRSIIKKYADHIGFPIFIGEGEKAEQLNTASSLWSRSKNEISEQQYKEFYRHVSHSFDDPWLTLHTNVEGVVSYKSLLFIPEQPPFDLFEPDRKGRVKLYVRKVFITEECDGLVPPYMRFLRGVVDSEDLPLNISRETFQHDPRLARIKTSLVKRIFDELAKKSKDAPAEYEKFWANFGAVLKEGLYEDFENRDRILELSRFRSTAQETPVTLADYVERMKPGQTAIYTISGEDVDNLAKSPQLEGFRSKGVEVLLLTDPIDEFWLPSVGRYQEKPFKSVAAADTDLDEIADLEPSDGDGREKPEPAAGLDQLVSRLKTILKDVVKDVRPSKRLKDSAVCLVAGEGDMDMHLERLLRRHQESDKNGPLLRILELNPSHPLIRRLAELAEHSDGATDVLSDGAFLLLDQARIVEGEVIPDPTAFARRLSSVMENSLAHV